MRRPAALLALLLSVGFLTPIAATAQTPAPTGSAWVDLVSGTPGLVAYWRLDEATGKALDLSPARHDADWPDSPNRLGPSLLATDEDPAAALTGADGQSIDAGDVLDFVGKAPFTITFWTLPGQQTAPYPRFISKEGSDDAGRQGFLLYQNATSGRIGLERWRDGQPDVLTTPDPLPSDRPTFVAAAYDGGSLRLFVNGSQVAQGKAERELPDTDYPLRVAARSDGTSPFAGTLDEMAIFDRALTPEEVATLFTAGSGVEPGNAPPAPAGPAPAQAAATPAGQPVAQDGAIVVGTVAPGAGTAPTPAPTQEPAVAVAAATEPAGAVVEANAPQQQQADKPAAPAPATKAVASEDLNLRAAPSGDSLVIDIIPSGTTVDLLGDTVGEYASVSINGQVGWVARQYLKPAG